MFLRVEKKRNYKLMKKIKFRGIEYQVDKFRYHNGRVGLLLTETAVPNNTINCTVNLASSNINDDQVIIKNWGENQGLYTVLLDSGVIKSYSRRIPIGLEYGLLTHLKTDKDD